MYQKSAKAGSQSGIGRLNGHGEGGGGQLRETENGNAEEHLNNHQEVLSRR